VEKLAGEFKGAAAVLAMIPAVADKKKGDGKGGNDGVSTTNGQKKKKKKKGKA